MMSKDILLFTFGIIRIVSLTLQSTGKPEVHRHSIKQSFFSSPPFLAFIPAAIDGWRSSDPGSGARPWHELIHATRWPHVRKGTVFGLGRVDIKLNQVIFLPIK